jgi:hypothetical protein
MSALYPYSLPGANVESIKIFLTVNPSLQFKQKIKLYFSFQYKQANGQTTSLLSIFLVA